jgi:hypothetical protein
MVIINKETGRNLKRGEIPEKPIPENSKFNVFPEDPHSPQFKWDEYLKMYLEDCCKKDKFKFLLSDVKDYFIQKELNQDHTLRCNEKYMAKLPLSEYNNRIKTALKWIDSKYPNINLQSNGDIWTIVIKKENKE